MASLKQIQSKNHSAASGEGKWRTNWTGWDGLKPTEHVDVPSGYVKIAIENGHRNSGFTQ